MTEQFFVVESPAELCAVIEQRHPLVKQAYDELGTAKVQALKYHVGNIRRELVKGLSIGDDYKIVRMINDAFQKQHPYLCPKPYNSIELFCIIIESESYSYMEICRPV